MIKLSLITKNQETVTLKSEIKGSKDEIANELYVILKHFETYYPDQMVYAVGKVISDYMEEEDG